MQVGDFVRCLFPFREVRGPGPFPHIVLILALSGRDEARVAYVAYTTTNVGFAGQRRPRQHLFVDDRAARALGQSKAFVIDVTRVAKLPVNVEFFPDLLNENRPDFGNDLGTVDRVTRRVQELVREGWRVDAIDLTVPTGPKVGR